MIRGCVSADASATFDGKELPRTGVHATVDGWVAEGVDVARRYEELGERCFEDLRGAFAAAIWDARERKLVLARDLFGTRALHHASDHGRFLFASEPSGILGELRGKPHVDPISIDDVLAFGWTERRRTGYEEIERLLPGEIAVFREGRLERRLRPDPSRTAEPRPGDALVRSLEHAAKDHLDGGAPPAVLFGLDQGSVVLTETLARIARGPVRTYAAVLEGGGSTIRAAAERFGARHEEIAVPSKDLPQIAEEALFSLDEPFADPEFVLLRLACRAAREDAPACFSADGGAQVLAFGERYAWMRTTGSAPRPPSALVPLYRLLAGALSSVGSTPLRARLATRIAYEEQRYVSTLVATESVLRRRLFSKDAVAAHRRNAGERELADDFGLAGELDARMRRHDFRHALPNRILARTRRAAEACGLEVRFPFLDPEVVAEAGSSPLSGGASEGLSAADRIATLVLPLVDAYLVESRIAADGWLARRAIAAVLREHRRRPELGRTVFALLALEIWYRKRILGI